MHRYGPTEPAEPSSPAVLHSLFPGAAGQQLQKGAGRPSIPRSSLSGPLRALTRGRQSLGGPRARAAQHSPALPTLPLVPLPPRPDACRQLPASGPLLTIAPGPKSPRQSLAPPRRLRAGGPARQPAPPACVLGLSGGSAPAPDHSAWFPGSQQRPGALRGYQSMGAQAAVLFLQAQAAERSEMRPLTPPSWPRPPQPMF
ncbi:hypothetical protein NDU88_004160 [Pleurodeles waltl]|uniref:Uncharacterized protein n=1 Tax=Pleurodeles waltl TaxID=8319 RepID=A0AAV7RK80_PLEWA|nr:hypothetical protein NDU88_004160 [Pleurodeles waltl]